MGREALDSRASRVLRRSRLALVAVAVVASCSMVSAGASGSAKPLRVGLVVSRDIPTGADSGLLQVFEKTVKQLGLEARVVYQPPSYDTRGPLTDLARQKYGLIITGVNTDPTVIGRVAANFPGSSFFTPGASQQDLGRKSANVEGSVYHAEQAGYLAGFLAAKMESRDPGRAVISSVGGYPVPPVDAFIAGYEAGAKRADPRITVLRAYASSFNDPSKCRSAALGQIAAGSGVVFAAAGACGIGALEAAKAKGVWGVGVDDDQSSLGPFILTSAVKRWSRGMVDALRSFANGTLTTGGNNVYDLHNNGVGLGKISPQVPASIRRQLARIRAQIVAGTIVMPSRLK